MHLAVKVSACALLVCSLGCKTPGVFGWPTHDAPPNGKKVSQYTYDDAVEYCAPIRMDLEDRSSDMLASIFSVAGIGLEAAAVVTVATSPAITTEITTNYPFVTPASATVTGAVLSAVGFGALYVSNYFEEIEKDSLVASSDIRLLTYTAEAIAKGDPPNGNTAFRLADECYQTLQDRKSRKHGMTMKAIDGLRDRLELEKEKSKTAQRKADAAAKALSAAKAKLLDDCGDDGVCRSKAEAAFVSP